jgi:hypothetical protein
MVGQPPGPALVERSQVAEPGRIRGRVVEVIVDHVDVGIAGPHSSQVLRPALARLPHHRPDRSRLRGATLGSTLLAVSSWRIIGGDSRNTS